MSPRTLAAIEALAPDVEAFAEALRLDWGYSAQIAQDAHKLAERLARRAARAA